MDTNQTRELFSLIIQKPTLTDQLLQRPPFKFIHDIVKETLRSTGYPAGLFSEDELNPTKAGSSRENKIAFLQKLIDVLNIDGNLDNVKTAKIVAGKEPEMTNALLQSLASEAAAYKNERAKQSVIENTPASKTKLSSSSKSYGEKGSKNKTTKSSSKTKAKIDDVEKKNKSKERKSSIAKENLKDKERKKKKSEAKTTASGKSSASFNNSQTENEQFPATVPLYDSELPDPRRTPPDRESSGGTSKGGDDSGIAEETGAESERHDFSERYGSSDVVTSDLAKISSPEFIEIHSPSAPETSSSRPGGNSIGRPQTSIGRPGTAIARPAPPKPRKNIIAANLNLESEELNKDVDAEQMNFILEDGKDETEKSIEFLIQEDEEGQFLMDIGKEEGINVSKLEKGDEHGILVNKIIENTRELEKDHIQIEDNFNQDDSFIDLHEQRRLRIEIESAQKSLQKTTQLLQPLVYTFGFAADDFDAVLKELEDYRRQSRLIEQQLDEQLMQTNSQTTNINAALQALDNEIEDIREKIAVMTASILRNEQKMAEFIAAKPN